MAVVCSSLTVIQCVCARSPSGVLASGEPDAGRWFCGKKLLVSNQRLSQAIDDLKRGAVNSSVNSTSASPFSRAAELASDRDDPAGDSQLNGEDVEFACSQPCLRAAARRFIEPVAVGFDSYINSKTRPPPGKQRQAKPQIPASVLFLPSCLSALPASHRLDALQSHFSCETSFSDVIAIGVEPAANSDCRRRVKAALLFANGIVFNPKPN